MKKHKIYLILLALSLNVSCLTQADSDALFQVNSYALFAGGDYDGFYSYKKILMDGDFGIGTFDRLNGEMVLLDGEIYRIEPNGKAIVMTQKEIAPLASYCHFDTDIEFEVDGLDLDAIKAKIDESLPDLKLFYAVRIEGEFLEILTRSIYAQDKPYKILTEVIKEEVRTESKNIKGTIVGFRAPEHMEQSLWKDYHLHFISESLDFGGHVHNALMGKVTVKIDVMSDFQLIMNDK